VEEISTPSLVDYGDVSTGNSSNRPVYHDDEDEASVENDFGTKLTLHAQKNLKRILKVAS
jgi:hypothetical protein